MRFLTSKRSPANHIFSKSDLERVLVMQLDDPGAIVMLSPALRALREALPQAELTLMTSATGGQVAPLLPWVDNVLIDQAVGQAGAGTRSINLREEVALVERLRRHDFSIALIFTGVAQSSLRAAYACNLAGIPYRVGFAQGLSQTVLSHFVISPMDDMHQVDRNLDLLRAIGISGENQTVELNIPPSIENRAEDLLKAAGVKTDTPYIVFAPGSSGVLGPYDPGHYATVAHILAAQAEQQLVIVGSSTDAKGIQPVLQVVTENLYGNVHSLVDKTTLPELAAVIEHASLTVANHSISMHFADAFGCPMVILYSENDRIQQWAPRHASARLLRRPAVCSRCEQVGCLNGMNCRDVRPEEVAIAALEILSEQTIDQVEYKRIFEYKFQSETNQQWAIC